MRSFYVLDFDLPEPKGRGGVQQLPRAAGTLRSAPLLILEVVIEDRLVIPAAVEHANDGNLIGVILLRS